VITPRSTFAVWLVASTGSLGAGSVIVTAAVGCGAPLWMAGGIAVAAGALAGWSVARHPSLRRVEAPIGNPVPA
jgi:hypothetical protein